MLDLFESTVRVARNTQRPTLQGVIGYFGHQALANTLGWTAGLVAAWLMKRFFEVRGLRNLWGLLASRDRVLVSPDEHHVIMAIASYSAGLIMLMVVRHLVLRVISEFHALRQERRRGAPPVAR